ncbi:MAG: pyridoxal phosphate-dependent aminotransferase family protein [Gammaproteobacteria bacterium]|nr:pyridoxal phosphate-dependent aminotransferase family protein [Gammaproteobacteria bacterium]
MDELSHASIQSGVYSATRKVTACKHLDVDAMIAAIEDIRAKDTKNGILVVTESLFSMDSDTPDLAKLQASCRNLNAILMVDAAHDLGCLGPDGRGHIGMQKMLGKIDLVMGSFSKTFASNGGFLAMHKRSVRHFMKFYSGPHTFSNAISPVQCAVVSKVLEIVKSDLGQQLRNDLLTAVDALRDEFNNLDIKCMGNPSAIVPVPVGSEATARIASWLMFQRGVLANLVEFPAVRARCARFRMQVMSSHTPEQTRAAAKVVAACIDEARDIANSIKE